MKKNVSLLLVICMLIIALSGCGNTTQESSSGDATPIETKKDPYADVDENTLDGGVYKLHSANAVEALKTHPDASFVLLCNIDLCGAELTPFEFSGNLNGNNFKFYNYSIKAEGENIGFFSKNSGTIKDITFADFTIDITDSSVKYAGGFCGINTGSLTGVKTASGVIKLSGSASATVGSGVGLIEGGSYIRSSFDTDLLIDAKVIAGGICGENAGVSVNSTDASGRIEITNKDATVGLLCGNAKSGSSFTECMYRGEMNTKNGEFYTEKIGSGEATLETCYIRDNSNSYEFETEELRSMRDDVVDVMYRMGTYEWTPSDMLMYTCSDGNSYCSQIYMKDYTYYGLPYTHKNGTIERMQYCFNEDGSFKDWVPIVGYDGYDMFMGNDCSGAVFAAWTKVSTSVRFKWTSDMLPGNLTGAVPVGNYAWAASSTDSYDVIKATNDTEAMLEAYAALHKGDALVTYFNDKENNASKNHAHLLAEDPCVIRDDEGKISIEYSTITSHGQGEASVKNGGTTTWSLFCVETFDFVFNTRHYLPVTTQELIDGKRPEVEVSFEDYGAVEKASLYTGKITSNYRLISAVMNITDDDGNVVFNDEFFTGVGKYATQNTDFYMRQYFTELDMSDYAATLQALELKEGETYHVSLSAYLGNEQSYEVKTWDITG